MLHHTSYKIRKQEPILACKSNPVLALVFVFYYMRYNKGTGYYFTAALIMTLYGESISSLAAVFALVFIYLYNGEKGKYGNRIKWFFYVFYPVHMMILGIIGRFL